MPRPQLFPFLLTCAAGLLLGCAIGDDYCTDDDAGATPCLRDDGALCDDDGQCRSGRCLRVIDLDGEVVQICASEQP